MINRKSIVNSPDDRLRQFNRMPIPNTHTNILSLTVNTSRTDTQTHISVRAHTQTHILTAGPLTYMCAQTHTRTQHTHRHTHTHTHTHTYSRNVLLPLADE